MRVRELWRRANETIREERDERSELTDLRVVCVVLAAVSITAFSVVFLLILLPLSADQRFNGLAMMPVLMLVVAAVTDSLAARRHRPPSRDLRRAVTQRALLLGLPVLGGLTGGLADLAGNGQLEHAIRSGLVLMLGLGVGLAIRLWWPNRDR